ncbi:hypothetical protein [Giesbergeria anulus]|uniref:Uncharacterized protein n=1 Tax=Giesbergeria anulus TaxID=180197 RepID=A0A1H9NCH9_9BURK|nr:hypothetical protein [Giesbergeria anulus]SER33467.1 hypothetical protein SAMN02982919_02165 [Giesbergeria anulus]
MASFLAEVVAQNNVAAGFSVSGKIRAGFKAPTKATLENAQAVEIFRKVQEGKMSFQQAANEIKQKTGISNPFYPRNTPHFHAHPWDMESGKIASDKLMKLYGEKRDNDQEPRLYRFPVVFPDVGRNGIDTILGSGLAVRGPGMIGYRSQYSDDGVRSCVYLPPVVPNADTKRKQFVRRQFVIRSVCDTEKCVEYATGACRFAGTLRFYIPGMSGAGVFSLETGSTQAASEIYLRLTSILQECGRLPNFTPDGSPVFYITKAKKPRVHYDENGVKKQGDQWVVVLETEIDLTKVRQQQERRLLAAPKAPQKVVLPSSWLQSDDEDYDDAGGQVYGAAPAFMLENAPEIAPPKKPLSDLDRLNERADVYGIRRKVEEWATMRYGEGWNASDKVNLVCENFFAIEAKFSVNTAQFLDLQILVQDKGIPYQDVALPYIKHKFGGFGTGETLHQILNHLDELLEQGADSAISVMKNEIP